MCVGAERRAADSGLNDTGQVACRVARSLLVRGSETQHGLPRGCYSCLANARPAPGAIGGVAGSSPTTRPDQLIDRRPQRFPFTLFSGPREVGSCRKIQVINAAVGSWRLSILPCCLGHVRNSIRATAGKGVDCKDHNDVHKDCSICSRSHYRMEER